MAAKLQCWGQKLQRIGGISDTSGYEGEGAPCVCLPLHRSCHLLPSRQRCVGFPENSVMLLHRFVGLLFENSWQKTFKSHQFLGVSPSFQRSSWWKTIENPPLLPGFEHEKVQLCATCQKMVRSETGSAGVMRPGRPVLGKQ